MKKIIHQIFNKHKWWFKKKILTTPGDGDYLPVIIRVYKCKCGMRKRVTSQMFTHLGTSPKEVTYL